MPTRNSPTRLASTPSLLLFRSDNHRLADYRALAPFPRRPQTSRRTSRCATSWRRSCPRCPRTTDPTLERTNDPPPLTTRGGAPHPTPSSPTEPFIFAIAAPPPAAPIPTTSTRRNGSSRRRPRSRPPRVAEETRILSESSLRIARFRGCRTIHPRPFTWAASTCTSEA